MKKKNAPIKCIFVLPSLNAGGAERVVITLMNGLNRKIFSPQLIYCISKHSLREEIAPDIPVTCLHARGVISSMPYLLKELHSSKPDIIFSTMVHMNFCVLLLKPFLRKVKIIVREAIVPSYIFDRHPNLTPILRVLYKSLYKHADFVISPSESIINELKNNLKLYNVNHRLLYNPVNKKISCQEVCTTNITKSQSNSNEICFVTAGRLNYQKGFDRLIEHLGLLKKDFLWNLKILGDGPEKEMLEDLIIKNNLGNKVSLVGHINQPWLHFKKADCYILPSRWEGMPNVALESLASGTPVIGIREAGGIQEISDLAIKNDVIIADTIEELVGLMQNVKKKPINSTSKLPDPFKEENVLQKLEMLLTQHAV